MDKDLTLCPNFSLVCASLVYAKLQKDNYDESIYIFKNNRSTKPMLHSGRVNASYSISAEAYPCAFK